MTMSPHVYAPRVYVPHVYVPHVYVPHVYAPQGIDMCGTGMRDMSMAMFLSRGLRHMSMAMAFDTCLWPWPSTHVYGRGL